MIQVIDDQEEIDSYRKLAEIHDMPVIQIPFDQNIFDKAGTMFTKSFILVQAVKGNKSVYLINKQDKILDCAGKSVDVNINAFSWEHGETDFADDTFIERFEAFVFEEFEEYTYKIAAHILQKYSEKIIIFCDRKAEYFWEGENRISVVSQIPVSVKEKPETVLYVYSRSKDRESARKLFYHVYSSIQVMSSLCWTCSADDTGNEGKTGLLINTSFGTECGLAYIIRTVSVLQALAVERGWLPIVRLSGNMYVDNPEHNMWEQYFQPDQRYAEQMIAECKNIIDLEKNHFSPLAIYYNPYFTEGWHDTSRHIKPVLKENVYNEFNESLFKPLKERLYRVLGVLIRGTDASQKASDITSIQYMIRQCENQIKNGRFDYLFLATEDQNIFMHFQNRFQEKLLYVEQQRVCRKNGELVGDLLDRQVSEKEQFGKKYLFITYCLSKCDALLFNIKSGGYYLTKMWMENEFEYEKQLQYEPSEIEKMCLVSEWLKAGRRVVIYGTGNICSKIMKFLHRFQGAVEYCDGKAQEHACTYRGKDVMKPDELIKKYKKETCAVVIASANYYKEIKNYLLKNGIELQDLIVFEDKEGILA